MSWGIELWVTSCDLFTLLVRFILNWSKQKNEFCFTSNRFMIDVFSFRSCLATIFKFIFPLLQTCWHSIVWLERVFSATIAKITASDFNRVASSKCWQQFIVFTFRLIRHISRLFIGKQSNYFFFCFHFAFETGSIRKYQLSHQQRNRFFGSIWIVHQRTVCNRNWICFEIASVSQKSSIQEKGGQWCSVSHLSLVLKQVRCWHKPIAQLNSPGQKRRMPFLI